jgi:hypothetical protein
VAPQLAETAGTEPIALIDQYLHKIDLGAPMERHELSRQFEALIADIFRQQSLTVEFEPAARLTERGLQSRPDLIVTSPTTQVIVEVKLWRSSRVATALVLQALDQLERYKRLFEIERGVLAISTVLTDAQKEAVSQLYPTTTIYDIGVLTFLASQNATLVSRLESIIQEALPFSSKLEVTPEAPRPEATDAPALDGPPILPEEPPRGAHLCEQLTSMPTGRNHWRRYEKACTEALKFVFEDELTGWEEQKRTESGLSIYDTVCRVVPRHDLWSMIVDQFHSRYIIFEFKNYSKLIKQGQIYTTEKYLFRPALRSVAIIISRNGADHNAMAACQGALREHGKLIVNLTVQDICDMLHEKDDKNDANSLLLAKIDQMLMRLER